MIRFNTQVSFKIMIGAIQYHVKGKYKLYIYQSGKYNNIDWNSESLCDLGDEYKLFEYKNSSNCKQLIIIKKELDDTYNLRLIETQWYNIKIENDSNNETVINSNMFHFQNEANKLLKCERDDGSIRFQYVNYLGKSRLYFLDRECINFEIVPNKIDYEDDYIKLTESLADACSNLLLDYSGSTSNSFSQNTDISKSLLEQFIFLRKYCYDENIRGLYEFIKRNPDRLLIHDEEYKPFGYAKPSQKFYNAPFSYSKNWICVGDASTFLPSEIAVTRKYESYDTPANRFIKFALKCFDSVCIDLMNILDKNSKDGKKNKQTECYKEAKRLHEILEDIFNDSFIKQIGLLDTVPQNNQVLQKREGYSQIFTAYMMLELALQLDWKGKDAIYEGESKDVALLYEYWLFFELYKVIKSVEGCVELNYDSDYSFIDLNGDSLTINLKEGKLSCQSFVLENKGIMINLYYNRTFSKTDFESTKYEGSYSRPFRPDYTIALFPLERNKDKYRKETDAIKDGTVSYIHFDAKYRIEDLTSFVGIGNTTEDEEKEVEEDKVGSITNTYKRGDLLKMHTYNDAIRRTIGSFVLYPGSNNDKKFNLYDEILPGVGAFSIKPSNQSSSENTLKEFISELIDSKIKHHSRLNRLNYYSEIIIKEPSANNESSLNYAVNSKYVVGYLRSGGNGYYDFLKSNDKLKNQKEFLFYFYAIKGTFVYSHHKDLFTTKYFRFYTNNINEDGGYKIDSIICRINSYELVSKEILVSKLNALGYKTSLDNHNADFYYVLHVVVENDLMDTKFISLKDMNNQNGNDSFSPHSPKIIG